MTENNQIAVNLRGPEMATIFMNPVFHDADFRALFRFIPTNESKLKLGFVGKLKSILQSGDKCGFTPKGNVPLTERCIDTKLAKINLQQCFDEFLNSIIEQTYRLGLDITNLDGNVIQTIIADRVRNALKTDIYNLAFFGDVNSTDEALSLADGAWTKIIPDLVQTPNSGITVVDGGSGVFAPGDGLAFVRNLYYNARNELKGLPVSSRVIVVSGAVYDAYERDLQDGSISSGVYTTVLIDGIERLAYNRVPIIPMYEWDTNTALLPAAYQPNGNDPLRLGMYTSVDNMIIAADVFNPEFRMWYDELEELNYIKSRFRIGFDYVHAVFFSVSYENASPILPN